MSDGMRTSPQGSPIDALRCRLGFHRWAYMGEAVARSTPHIAYPVNQVCLACHVLRFNAVAPGRPTPDRSPTEARFMRDGGQLSTPGNPKKITRLERFVRWFDRMTAAIFGPRHIEVDDD